MDETIIYRRKMKIRAFDTLKEMKTTDIPRKEAIESVHLDFGIPKGTLYSWYSDSIQPYGRRGEILQFAELYYCLGALLGDGCLYNWRTTNYYVILVGDFEFTTKFSRFISKCTGKQVRPYIDRSKNIWFVRTNNFQLYSFFEKAREDIKCLEKTINEKGRIVALYFIEGFFDAEGCVKVIKEPSRKTPKICLDITNTNFEYLELIRKLFKRHLEIEGRYSIQKPGLGQDGFLRKKAYHLRIYKKEFVRKFFNNIHTTKLKENKIHLVHNWLNNGK